MTTPVKSPQQTAIDPATAMGTVRLTVSDVARAREFYERVIGLQSTDGDDGAVRLGTPGYRPLVELRGDPSAPKLDRRATGLFHLAILLPTRRDLAFALARIVANRWPLDGASDHLVSEALYLSDPDGNGIEIYRDRPRDQWQRVDGTLQMATLPLDLHSIGAEIAGASEAEATVPPGTTIGHVHLQVSELRDIESFYRGVLGFEVTVRTYPGALFVSAGGYHHHLGLNTWHSAGARPPGPGSIGLRSFEILLPDEGALSSVVERVQAAGLAPAPDDGGWFVRDPSGNGVLLRTT